MNLRDDGGVEVGHGADQVIRIDFSDAFDAEGNLTKEPMQKVMKQYIDAYAAFVDKQNR